MGPVMAIGLWLHSNFVRYSGAVWFLIFGGVGLWSVYSAAGSASSLFKIISAAEPLLALSISVAVLCSPPFDKEFAQRRATEPRAKLIGRLILIALLMAALAAAVYHRW
jgi:cellobiose-specific phosphotransferase system component IIC